MHNNEEVLPHFILQLIHLFAVLPPETAFLSIYESGSTDNTGELTETTLLHAFSTRKRSPFCIVRQSGSCHEVPIRSSWLLFLC